MQVLRIGNAPGSIGLIRFDTTWFRMPAAALSKIVACAQALAVSKRAFETCLTASFAGDERKAARAFLLKHARQERATRPVFDRDLTDFLATAKSLRFMDYSKEARTRTEDLERMTRFAAAEAPPPLAHHIEGAGRVRLPMPLRDIAEWTFRNHFTSKFLNHEVGKRGVPSHGARQPFDAIFSYRAGGKRVDAYFDPQTGRAHAIAQPKGARAERGNAQTIQLFACYERVQWRYRHSGYYDTLLLDAGHIIGNVFRMAAAHGWRVSRCSEPQLQPSAWKPFVNEAFVEIDIVKGRARARH